MNEQLKEFIDAQSKETLHVKNKLENKMDKNKFYNKVLTSFFKSLGNTFSLIIIKKNPDLFPALAISLLDNDDDLSHELAKQIELFSMFDLFDEFMNMGVSNPITKLRQIIMFPINAWIMKLILGFDMYDKKFKNPGLISIFILMMSDILTIKDSRPA